MNATLAFQQTEGVDPKTEPGINMETVISQGRQYPASYKDWDVPFMKVLLDTEGLRATFSGHDHLNDWYGQTLKPICFIIEPVFLTDFL